MFKNLPAVTRTLLLVNIGVFLLQQVADNLLMALFALWPSASRLFQPWQMITYAFLHGGFTHILFNMVALYSFGAPLEYWFGARRFCAYYFSCVLTAAAVQEGIAALTHSGAPTLGASGGIFGLLLAFAWYFPHRRIMLAIPIPMPAWLLIPVYGLLELFLGVTGREASVAHFAHLGGMVGGAAMILYWYLADPTHQRFRHLG